MISVILLAAGTSSRMGDTNKLLLPIKGNPMVRQVAKQLLDSPLDEVIVVLGHEEPQVRTALEGLPLRFEFNSDYHLGMTSSIQVGVSALSPDCHAFLVCLGDMPLLTAAHYEALIHFFEENKKVCPAPIVRPADRHRKGHPVVFDIRYVAEIQACKEREGCREVIRKHRDQLVEFQVSEEAFFRDVDGEEDYLKII
ncbi:MAG: nucleotidyltransferase family protein [Saprospirales bacterium]|nr:nucleotidyltransferase family protein [Saprospirales bacterium]